jgi:hypothetical protein
MSERNGSDHIEDSLPLDTDDLAGESLPEGQALEASEYTDETNTYGGPTRLGQNDRTSLNQAVEDSEFVEIPVGGIESWTNNSGVRSPELYDQNVPGEIDIEALDENALSDTDIPRDALLDPLEE